MTPDDVAALRSLGVSRSWPPGGVLFHEGDAADRVLLIDSGTVKVLTTSATGVTRVLGLRNAGDVIGELSAIDGGTRSAMAVAATPVVATAIDIARFREYLRVKPGAALALLSTVTSRLRAADRQRAEFGSADATARVAAALAELARTHGRREGDDIRLELLSQEELAALCGSSREAVARAFSTFRRAGLVDTGRRIVVVHDLAALDGWGRGPVRS